MNDNYDDVEEGIDLDNFSIEEEIAKFDSIIPPYSNWELVLRLYVSPNKTKSGLFISSKHAENEESRSCVGLVVKISDAAYKDSRYETTGKWCKLGQWWAFARHAGPKIYLNGMPTFVLKEDALLIPVYDPRSVSRDKPTANRNF